MIARTTCVYCGSPGCHTPTTHTVTGTATESGTLFPLRHNGTVYVLVPSAPEPDFRIPAFEDKGRGKGWYRKFEKRKW